MTGALDGVRVLEFSQVVAAPFCGMLLADMGADVIKIEPPNGEPWRHLGQILPFESKPFMALNRGKRSLPLDLTTPEGQRIMHALTCTADVVITNYRPDVACRHRFDYETLSALNPRLVYCENTAFGRQGPDSHRPGYDLIVQAMSGMLAAENKVAAGVPQPISSTTLNDYVAGSLMAWGITGALYARERTGRGQKVEATLLGAALAIQTMNFNLVASYDTAWMPEMLDHLHAAQAAGADWETLAQIRQNAPIRGATGPIYYRTYQTRDAFIAVGCLSNPLRRKLLDALGLRDARLDDPGWDPTTPEAKEHDRALIAAAEALFAARPTAEWLALFDEAGIPAGPVRFLEEMFDDPQVLANGLVVELEHALAGSIRMVGTPITMSGTPTSARSASPVLGEHTDALLAELGYDEAAIADLRATGVVR
jgi:formyl-CoA transferase